MADAAATSSFWPRTLYSKEGVKKQRRSIGKRKKKKKTNKQTTLFLSRPSFCLMPDWFGMRCPSDLLFLSLFSISDIFARNKRARNTRRSLCSPPESASVGAAPCCRECRSIGELRRALFAFFGPPGNAFGKKPNIIPRTVLFTEYYC